MFMYRHQTTGQKRSTYKRDLFYESAENVAELKYFGKTMTAS
jgi:hypothetical protein